MFFNFLYKFGLAPTVCRLKPFLGMTCCIFWVNPFTQLWRHLESFGYTLCWQGMSFVSFPMLSTIIKQPGEIRVEVNLCGTPVPSRLKLPRIGWGYSMKAPYHRDCGGGVHRRFDVTNCQGWWGHSMPIAEYIVGLSMALPKSHANDKNFPYQRCPIER